MIRGNITPEGELLRRMANIIKNGFEIADITELLQMHVFDIDGGGDDRETLTEAYKNMLKDRIKAAECRAGAYKGCTDGSYMAALDGYGYYRYKKELEKFEKEGLKGYE